MREQLTRRATREVVPRRGVARVAALALALVALAALGATLTRDYLVSEEVRVPGVVGVTYAEAQVRLQEAGLTARPFAERDARAQPDQVLSQSPAAGQLVRPGRQIAVGVNTMAELRTAPGLVGLRERDAVARAEAIGASVSRVVYVEADAPAGTVVWQEPAPGTALAPLQTMVVSVSRGAVEAPFELPDLRGWAIDRAVAELATLGVRHVERLAAAVSFDRPGSVTDQRPAPGSEVTTTTPVTLVYAVEGTLVVRVPELEGLPLWRAQLALRAARLALGPVRHIDDPNLPTGVVSSRPSSYTVVGSPVAVVVNGAIGELGFGTTADAAWSLDVTPPPLSGAGAPTLADIEPTARSDEPDLPAPGTAWLGDDGSRTIPFRFDPAAVGIASLLRESYRLRLVVIDDEGERTVFDRELGAGEGMEAPVRVVGNEPMLQTFINEAFFQAWRP